MVGYGSKNALVSDLSMPLFCSFFSPRGWNFLVLEMTHGLVFWVIGGPCNTGRLDIVDVLVLQDWLSAVGR